MRGHDRSRGLAALVTAIVLASGCATGERPPDKAGGPGEPFILRMASASGDLRLHPAVDYFVHRVEEVSGGQLRIQVMSKWADFAPDAEEQIVRSVAAGEVELGWVGSRVFDTMGVLDFQALTAPMLVDSYALENAVIESGITERMANALDAVGVVGLGVLPDGLRKPIGVDRPIAGPADWRGIAFGTFRSNGHAEAIRALGATPTELTGTFRDEAVKAKTIDGFELSMHAYGATLQNLAPYVTSNLNLWPLMDVLLGNADGLGKLTTAERSWLDGATEDARGHSQALLEKEPDLMQTACATGARFGTAAARDLAALRDAFAPVYVELERDAATKVFIDEIQALKRSTESEEPPVMPPECTSPVRP